MILQGVKRFYASVYKAINSVQGIALAFDVTSKKYFDDINIWLDQIKKNLSNPTLILLGNKIDISKDKWQVTQE